MLGTQMQAAHLTSSGNETQFNLGNKETHMASNVIRPTLAVPSSSNATDTFTMATSSVHFDSTILEQHFNDLPEDLSVFVPNDITIPIPDASLSIQPVPAPIRLPVSPDSTIIVPRPRRSTRAWEMYKDDKLPQLVDPLLNKDFCEVEAIRFLKVGLLCVQEECKLRPRMSTAMRMMSDEINIDNVHVSQPGLITDMMAVRTSQKHSLNSINSMHSPGYSPLHL
nr:cysteine-rich receptor-like protein kinase 18 [Quercus suber]